MMHCFPTPPTVGAAVRTRIRTGRRRDQFAEVTGTLKAIVGDMAFITGHNWPPLHDGSLPVYVTWVWVPLMTVAVCEGDGRDSLAM